MHRATLEFSPVGLFGPGRHTVTGVSCVSLQKALSTRRFLQILTPWSIPIGCYGLKKFWSITLPT
jgi:hypothetical protein